MLSKSVIDVLFSQETKLDESFPHEQFHVNNLTLYRKDVNDHCGGIMALVRSDIPQRRRYDLETCDGKSGRIELEIYSLCYEKKNGFCVVSINSQK
jgi:exonuclease III